MIKYNLYNISHCSSSVMSKSYSNGTGTSSLVQFDNLISFMLYATVCYAKSVWFEMYHVWTSQMDGPLVVCRRTNSYASGSVALSFTSFEKNSNCKHLTRPFKTRTLAA